MKQRWVLAGLLLAGTRLWASPATGVDVVMAGYAGTWSVSIDHLDTPHSKAGHDQNTLRNDCWKSGPYLACNQYVDGVSKALLVFTYDAASNRYTSYPIMADGSAAGHGTMEIHGDTWTFPWDAKDGGETTYYRVVNVFHGSDAIDFRQEYSKDQEHWTVMARGHETRLR